MFVKVLKSMLLIASLVIIGSISAQDNSLNYVIERDGQVLYITEENSTIILEDTNMIRLLGWDTSGIYFGDIAMNYPISDNLVDMLFIQFLGTEGWVDRSIPIDNPNLTYFGNSVLLTENTDQILVSEDEQGLAIIEIIVKELFMSGSMSDLFTVGSIPFGVGCGGSGVRNSLDTIYSEEVRGDVYGEYNQTVLAPTPYGIVHSNSCTAIRTLLTQPDTLESVELGDNLRWANVAHDGEHVVGTMGNTFFAVDLETLQTDLIYPADAPIVSSVWSYDSETIYFVARISTGEILPIEDNDNVLLEERTFMSNAPLQSDAQIWESVLYQYDFTTDTLTELYSAEAYALGNLTIVGDVLFFSQIETPFEWLQAYVDNPETADSDLIERTYWLYDFNTGDTTQLEGDYAGAFIQPAP